MATTQLAQAVFTPQGGSSDYEAITVHFNPSSLQYDIQNTLDSGRGSATKQYVSQSTAKLSLELIFDTTDTGQDVRAETFKIGKYMMPGPDKSPPVVLFEWGAFKFQGMLDSFKEKIDFFSADGVPLRSTVSVAMSQQDQVFSREGQGGASDVAGAPGFEVPGGGGAAAVAQQGGDGRASRAIGAANGQASLRFGAGAGLVVGGGVELKGAAGFSAGAGTGIGIGLEAGGGVGLSAGASVSLSAAAGGGVSAGSGSSSLARFSGLQSGSQVQAPSFKPQNLLSARPSAGLSTDSGASFSLGGQAQQQGGSGLSADVGAGAGLQAGLSFDD